MWLFALMHLLQRATCLPVAVPTQVWVSGQELLKNSTMTDPNIPACLITPAILDPDFRHENHPTAKLRGSLRNAHGGSDAFVLISPVPCERPLLFTFSAYTAAKNQTLMLIVSANSDKGKILRFYSDAPHNPFGQIVALSAGQWVKINKTYIVPKGTQTLQISVNNSNSQDVHIADAHLVVGESGAKQE